MSKFKRHISNPGKDGLASEVLKIPHKLIRKDEESEYIPFCDYEFHKGIILNEEPCKYRDCKHYNIFRMYQNE